MKGMDSMSPALKVGSSSLLEDANEEEIKEENHHGTRAKCKQAFKSYTDSPNYFITAAFSQIQSPCPKSTFQKKLKRGKKHTNNTPQLNDTNICTPRNLIYWYCSNSLNPVLNSICDVWYNLFQKYHQK